MQPLAIVTGTSGAVSRAVESALARAGFAVLHVSVGPDGRAPGGPAPSGVAAVVHVGLRTPRHLAEDLRARAAAAAAGAAADLAREARARRFVHVSSAAVYGRPRNLPCREGELKAPCTPEGRVRWRAEQESWARFRRGAPLTVLRPALMYGPTLRGGPLRLLSLLALLGQRRRRIPILRRGPVAHLLHVEDLASAVVHVVRHGDDRDVVGRAFNVGDEAPLALAEHFASAVAALGCLPGRVLPSLPRLAGAMSWAAGHLPDRILLDPLNRRLARRWRGLAERTGIDPALAPRIDREAFQWTSADHYYDTARLAALGWRPLHPISTAAVADTIRSLVAERLLPGSGAGVLPSW